MEDGDSIRHLNYDCSTDCNEHHFVHGTWSYLYVRQSPRYQAGALLISHSKDLKNAIFWL